ncbi:MAG TPA: ElyC/SanA/YdcF family protein [Cyclobacteriaceae bacterium]|jgi:SanA protein|nr:ElyC/SanA/YdcF family protein [Cyclobacteriaceae bacterium]
MKNIFKKLGNLVFYTVIVGLLFYLYSSGKEPKASGDSGFLIGIYNKFWRDADAFNLFFSMITFSACLILFVLFDSILTNLFKRLSVKKKWASFTTQLWFKRTIQFTCSCGLVILLFALLANIFIVTLGVRKTVKSTEVKKINDSIPALVLGTSKYLKGGVNKWKENKYFTYRMDAAKELWSAGKVKEFIVSGDKTGAYDETRDMKNDLISMGVPEEKVKVDTSGLRTMDSMHRLRNLFHVRECFIISQDFHVWRAIFQATLYKMRPIGYYAKGSSTWGMILRELQARPKAVLDLIYFNMMPVDKLDPEKMQIHKEFTMSSDKAIILVGFIIIAFIASLYVFFKYID